MEFYRGPAELLNAKGEHVAGLSVSLSLTGDPRGRRGWEGEGVGDDDLRIDDVGGMHTLRLPNGGQGEVILTLTRDGAGAPWTKFRGSGPPPTAE